MLNWKSSTVLRRHHLEAPLNRLVVARMKERTNFNHAYNSAVSSSTEMHSNPSAGFDAHEQATSHCVVDIPLIRRSSCTNNGGCWLFVGREFATRPFPFLMFHQLRGSFSRMESKGAWDVPAIAQTTPPSQITRAHLPHLGNSFLVEGILFDAALQEKQGTPIPLLGLHTGWGRPVRTR